MLRQEGKDKELGEAVVFATWRHVVGENLREHAVPFRLYRKTLIVAVSSETWKKHLEALSGQMLFKLNAALSKATVTFIEFRIDEQTVEAERERLYREQMSQVERERIAMKNVPQNVLAAAEKIENESLRRNFLLAAGSCLARKAQRK
jgi:predicted nucleic acid-binding Zn ribbon protein